MVAIALDVARRAKRKRKRGGKVHVGPIIGDTGGRADKRPMHVPDGSYVLTSTHVSGLGDGNTHAGMATLNKMFPVSARANTKDAKMIRRADGGRVAIQAADGEYIIDPRDIVQRFGSLEYGHKALDAWQEHDRKKLVHTIANLEPPAQD